ncbi:protein kinase domain-containing protein [Streptacidiphilus fuscans]|uniref:Protein kinase n=1 Tax=Streptacidiphilus fuscans TaxID=2789292 RepID=A0A931B2J5_9ACTN|nr:protein kinase [Streptacidiphilus fuscans]MBF9069086.1 protein kinase [Streptacidiphilus fuscans]
MRTLQDRFGQPLTAELLSDRRGSRAWKITGHSVRLALKANTPGADSGRDKVTELAQENATLTALTEAGAINPRYLVAAEPWQSGRWLAVRWIDGTPVYRAFATVRGVEGDLRTSRPWLLGVAHTWARQLAALHAAGWTHADVQPTNTLITHAGDAEVIDYALACGPTATPWLPYRGALTHTTAPEIAEALLSTHDDVHVQAESPADVWGLGASLYWCWTAQRPIAYADDVARVDKLRAIAKGETLPLEAGRPYPFPQFEELIRACLRPDPADRPTAAEAARW